jgi:alpha-amylase
MKKLKIIAAHLLIFIIVFLPSLSLSKTFHIMLQGFHWNSHSVSSGWYSIIIQNAQRIKDSGFTLIWLPPPSKSVSPQGYEPSQLNDLNSEYGTVDELKNVISVLSSAPEVKVIADIVINHRSGSTGWADFTNPDWPTDTIVSDDEWGGAKSINYDRGESAPFSRDLDHLNPKTQNGIKAWMLWLRNDIGFAGWRYDFVKGYSGSAIAVYNDHTSPDFSVGEYFDYNTQKVIDWIDSTHTNWMKRSTAFDFPFREALYQAVAWKNYDNLKYYDRSAGVIGVWSDKAVTFIENHDTEEARNSQYAPPFPGGDQMIQGYAVILTHPGTPCVFWIDIYDSGVSYENKIEELIKIRKEYKIHSESKVWIDKAERGQRYAAYIQGDRGEIAVKIGPGSWAPSGDKWDPVGDLLTSGNDYAVWGEHGKLW